MSESHPKSSAFKKKNFTVFEQSGDEMAECDSCKLWYHQHCMDIPSEVFSGLDVPWKCKKCEKLSFMHTKCADQLVLIFLLCKPTLYLNMSDPSHMVHRYVVSAH